MERISPQYELEELKSIQRKSQILSLQIEDKSHDGINIIWENQVQCAKEINKTLENKKIINILVYGKTQTGKTGCMTALIHYHVLSNNIPIENIYIITGLSDKAWKIDTKNRMPDCLNARVFHRANLKDFNDNIEKKRNLLIIMDEIQIASDQKQTISKTFKKCGFFNLEYLLKNDIKIVQFSATPDGHIHDIEDWGNHSKIIKLEPGDKYMSSYNLYEDGRILEYQDLYGWDEKTGTVSDETIKHIKEIKVEIDKYDAPLYHIIRIPNSKEMKDRRVIQNLQHVFEDDYEFIETLLSDIKIDIDVILSKPPLKHTFIFIKEILRCAKTMIKTYLGITYERYSSTIHDSTIIQGLVGRLTGYDDNGKTKCYTNIDTIQRYEDLWKSGFTNSKITWQSKSTNTKNGKTCSSHNTFNHPQNYDGLASTVPTYIDPHDKCKNIPVIIDITPELIQEIKGKKADKKRELIKEMIKNYKPDLYDEIKDHLIEQLTTPSEPNSIKKHITDIVKKSDKGERFYIDIKDKSQNILNVYIDNRENRLCCIIWNGSLTETQSPSIPTTPIDGIDTQQIEENTSNDIMNELELKLNSMPINKKRFRIILEQYNIHYEDKDTVKELKKKILDNQTIKNITID